MAAEKFKNLSGFQKKITTLKTFERIYKKITIETGEFGFRVKGGV